MSGSGYPRTKPQGLAAIDFRCESPCLVDSPTKSSDASLLIEKHQPGTIELAWEPREEEAGPFGRGSRFGPSPVSAVGLVQCFGSPRQTRSRARRAVSLMHLPEAISWVLSKPCDLIRHRLKRQEGRVGREVAQAWCRRLRGPPENCSLLPQACLVAAVHVGWLLPWRC